MDIYTMDRSYYKDYELDTFESAIWTERYYGDGDFEIKVPARMDLVNRVKPGTLLGCVGSDQPMIGQEIEIEDGLCTAKGITLVQWLKNRFIRSSPDNQITTWHVSAQAAEVLRTIVYNWATPSAYIADHTWPYPAASMGFQNASKLAIPGLVAQSYPTVNAFGHTIPTMTEDIPFIPVYEALKPIAEKYQLGMKIVLETDGSGNPSLGFYVYVGVMKTSSFFSTGGPIIFSPDMDNLIDVKELQSISEDIDVIFGWGTQIDHTVGMDEDDNPPRTNPDWDSNSMNQGLDLTARIFLDSALTDDDIGLTTAPNPWANYDAALHNQIIKMDFENLPVKLIDGQILPGSQFQYGEHFSLGDVVLVQGYTGEIVDGMVTEYIRSQDPSGEKAFPTVSDIKPEPPSY